MLEDREQQALEGQTGDDGTASMEGAAQGTVNAGTGASGKSQPAAASSETGRIEVRAGVRIGIYELVEPLGAGAMGEVWKARHRKLDKIVAIKLLPPHLMSDEAAVRRFEREMKAVGQLDHPNILRAMDAGEECGISYLVLEYVDGMDLARLVKMRGPQSISDAVRMLKDAALGLAHAHEHGLVHRDVKPSNLLLSKHGVVKVLDLGLALLQLDRSECEQLTHQGQVMGTPDFMAPEQWDDTHAVDGRADLYSLGCTFMFLVTGRTPFGDAAHRTVARKMKAHLLEPPPALSTLRPDVPKEIDRLVTRLLDKHPDERLQSANELVQRLDDYLNQRNDISSSSELTAILASIPATAAESSRPQTGLRELSRRRLRRLAAGTAMALAIAAAAVWWTGLFRTETALERRTSPAARTGDTAGLLESAPPTIEALKIPFAPSAAVQQQAAWAARLKTPVEWKNSLGMKFRLIPPGEFLMGMEESQAEAIADLNAGSEYWTTLARSSAPPHPVRLTRPFYLAVHETTQKDFELVMGRNPSRFGPTSAGAPDEAARRPVEMVSRADAVAFCLALENREAASPKDLGTNADDADGYRLPTEAEWEWACRAGTSALWFSGDHPSDLQDFAWYTGTTGGASAGGSTRAVAGLKPNAFGLYDMHGNVLEHCRDWHSRGSYETESLSIDPKGPETGEFVVLRGGNWDGHSAGCSSAFRYSTAPGYSNEFNGFRTAVSVEHVRSRL